ncbi:Cytochrome P450 6k1 [Gryllus bimaculatus]|nr:Cytochrome P450 6k1 [Gryllus bimaculatus]
MSCRSRCAPESGVLEMREILARYTTDTIASVGFGIQGNALKDPDAEFRRVLRKVVDFDFWLGLKSAVAFFAPSLLSTFRVRVWDSELTDFTRRVVWQTVEHREKTGLVRKDFLDLLMQIRAKGHVDGDGPHQPTATANGDAAAAADKTDGHAKDADGNIEFDGDLFAAQAFVFLAAGFETSSTTQTFAMYELACHPDVQTRLRREIRDALRANGGHLTYDAINNMTYLHHVVQETLRLYPVLPFLDRVSLADYKLPNTNITLDKGTTVMIPILGIQRDPAIFEDPNSFRPDRFDESKGPPGKGMRMGYMQVKVGLVHFLNHYEVRPSKHTVVPAQFDPKSFLLASNGGMRLTVTKLHDAVC